MLPVDLLSALKAYTLTQKPLLAATPDTVNGNSASNGAVNGTTKSNPLPFEPGQKLQGMVLAETAPGLFKVNVASQLVQMPLPATIRPGDTVELQVVSLQPHLVFSMVASTNPLSTQEQLSSAARIISSLAQQQPEKFVMHATQNSPLWASDSPPQTGQLAHLLRESLGNSGLFYEAHQAQWIDGARSTAQLLQEPQNRAAEQTSNATLAGKPVANTQTISTDTATVATQANGSANAPDHLQLPDHLKPLVQQQLNVLETNQAVWQGQVWPGQTMRWTIQDQEHHATASEEEQRQWVTQLQLELPKLGKVTATLQFNAAGVSLALDAATPETRTLLGGASTQLAASLSEAGIPVVSTLVTQHEA
jgi:plastocyanin